MSIREFWQLVFVKVKLNLKSEVSKSYLNYVWWVLEPALFVAVFYVVFGVLLERGGPGFLPFLICGKMSYLWYARSVSNCSGAILGGKALINSVAISKLFFPLVVVLQDCVKQMFVFGLLLFVLILLDVGVQWRWFYVPVIAVTQLIFILASGLIASAIVPILPDFRFIVATGLQLLMFGSGIFYHYESVVPSEYQALFIANPMAALIESYRDVLLYNTPPDFDRLGTIIVVSLCVIFLVSHIVNKYNAAYSKLVIQ